MGKYKKGTRIYELYALSKERVVFFHDRVINNAFFTNWQFRFVIQNLNMGNFYTAIPLEELPKINCFCKDCSYFTTNWFETNVCNYYGNEIQPYQYCSQGEPRK